QARELAELLELDDRLVTVRPVVLDLIPRRQPGELPPKRPHLTRAASAKRSGMPSGNRPGAWGGQLGLDGSPGVQAACCQDDTEEDYFDSRAQAPHLRKHARTNRASPDLTREANRTTLDF